MRPLIAALLLFGLAACARPPHTPGSEADIAALAATITAMSPTVDPTEARRAARVAYTGTYALARSYEITDRALVHNALVNAGLRPRGLCYHWAEDMVALLNAEGFKTLAMTRAIANAQSPVLIEHSTAVITAIGARMESGVVLDPWRHGGRLFWSPVQDDRRYGWQPREDVLRAKGQIKYVQRTQGSLAALPAD